MDCSFSENETFRRPEVVFIWGQRDRIPKNGTSHGHVRDAAQIQNWSKQKEDFIPNLMMGDPGPLSSKRAILRELSIACLDGS